MDKLAFLTFMMLINHQITHVIVEIFECRFLAKNEGQSYPLIQGAKFHPFTRGGPTSDTNWPISRRVINKRHKGPRVSVSAKGEGSWSQALVGQWVRLADGPGAPPTLSLDVAALHWFTKSVSGDKDVVLGREAGSSLLTPKSRRMDSRAPRMLGESI